MSASGGLGSLSRANRGGPSGVDEAALGLGHVRSARIRRRPLVPSWVLKVIMAITGVLFALFVLVHMIGNLKVFTGAESFNTYAHWLRTVLQPFLPYEGLLSTQRHRPKESDCADEERDYSHDGGAKLPAQGGINAARDNTADNDSLRRFVIDTVKGGDFRGREADAFRLAEESMRVVDHLNAIGAPFAREYGGTLATRSFGGVQVSRTFYARGQTGQQLQVASAQALQRQVDAGTVTLRIRHEMLDLIMDEGRVGGVVMRNLISGDITAHTAHAVVLCTGGYGNIFFHSTLAKNSNASAIWRAAQRGAHFASPSFIQFHPTALPISSTWQSKTILMSESLRNDGRIWVPVTPRDERPPTTFLKANATTTWSANIPPSATSRPATWPRVPPPSRSAPGTASGR